MRADPYARLLSLVDHYHRDKTSFTPQQEALIDTLRGDLPGLMDARARRLSDEASSLPPVSYLFRDVPHVVLSRTTHLHLDALFGVDSAYFFVAHRLHCGYLDNH